MELRERVRALSWSGPRMVTRKKENGEEKEKDKPESTD